MRKKYIPRGFSNTVIGRAVLVDLYSKPDYEFYH